MTDSPMFEPGSGWIARDTFANINNGIIPGSRVWLTFVDPTHISVVANCSGMPERRVHRSQFGGNFMQDPFAPNGPAYIASAHAKTDF